MLVFRVKQLRSRIGCTKNQKKILDALGLKKVGCSVEHLDSPSVLGMIKKVKHLVKVEK